MYIHMYNIYTINIGSSDSRNLCVLEPRKRRREPVNMRLLLVLPALCYPAAQCCCPPTTTTAVYLKPGHLQSQTGLTHCAHHTATTFW